MVKCKILVYTKKMQDVEDSMNEWLSEHPNIEIKAITATMQPNWTYTIFYEEN